jgi:hypothetical protein
MASAGGSKTRVRRENTVTTVTLLPSPREKLLAWLDRNRPLKLVASELRCTERWFWKLRNRHGPVDKNLVVMGALAVWEQPRPT